MDVYFQIRISRESTRRGVGPKGALGQLEGIEEGEGVGARRVDVPRERRLREMVHIGGGIWRKFRNELRESCST